MARLGDSWHLGFVLIGHITQEVLFLEGCTVCWELAGPNRNLSCGYCLI